MIETKEPEIYQETNPKTAPPKVWRNWWHIRDCYHLPCVDCGTMLHPGAIISCACDGPFPSRDIAITKADESEAYHAAVWPDVMIDRSPQYLGAFPEGERP